MKFKHTSHRTGSDDGLWTAIDGNTVNIIELAYWDDLDSSATPMYGKYNVQAGYVEIPENPEASHEVNGYSNDAVGSLRSCGWEFLGDRVTEPAFAADKHHRLDIYCPHTGDIIARYGKFGSKERRIWKLVLAEAMWGYGAKHIHSDESGNNRAKLMRSARANY